MKTKFIAPAILLGVSVMLTGCKDTLPPTTGFMISMPVGDIDPFNLGSKKGEACTSLFNRSVGLIDAAKKGNIRKIKYVETEIRTTPLTTNFCTIVYGD